MFSESFGVLLFLSVHLELQIALSLLGFHVVVALLYRPSYLGVTVGPLSKPPKPHPLSSALGLDSTSHLDESQISKTSASHAPSSGLVF